jgi:hypothetical protein
MIHLPTCVTSAQFSDMSTLAKVRKPAAESIVRGLPTKKTALEKELFSLAGTRKLPPAKGTAADLLAMGDKFGAGVDMKIVKAVYESRDRHAV